jgi:hypothetical protein
MVEVERDAAGYTKGQIRALKIAIAIMTFAIVAGLAVMVGTIAYRASTYKGGAEASAAAVPVVATGTAAETQLPAGGRVVSVTPWGDRLVITVEEAGGTSLLVLDPRTGKIEPLARLKKAP